MLEKEWWFEIRNVWTPENDLIHVYSEMGHKT